MKLGTKIIMGFVGILAILIILGCVAVYQMYGVQKKADILANEYIPEVKQMLTLTQKTYLMRLQALGIALSGKEKYYKGAQTARNELKAELTKFKKLVDNSEKLESGRKTAPLLIKGVDDYWTAADGMNTAMVEIAKYRKKRGVVGKDILALADTLVLKQKEKLERATAENVASYVESYQNASQIPLLMYKIRLGLSSSWANSNMEAMKKIIKEDFTLISAKVQAVVKNDPATADDVKKLLDDLKEYQGLMEDTVASWQNLNDYLGDAVKLGTAVVDQTVEVGAKASDATLVVAADTNSALSSASIVLMVGLSIATIVGILLAVIITRGITGPINRIINNLNESGEQVAAASGQISSASQSLAEGATEQAASLEESSSALEEMASMTRQNADNAGNANQMMIETQKQVSNGAESVQNMASAMSEINDSSEQISRIIKTIEEIAFQTNLLALNAAVEAARAGDAGKGFAVVADEVRNLAQRSAQAARDTADLIESTVARVKNGTEIVEELQESFGNVEKAANGVAGLINEISAASTEQAQGVDQVNTAVAQMDKVTQTNAANAEESASAAEELNAQAEQLRSLVGALVKLVRGKDAVVDSHTSMSVPKLHANRPLSLPHSSRSSGGSSAPAKRIESSTAKLVKPHDVIPLDDDDDDFSDF